MKCKRERTGLNGLFCANFGTSVGNSPPCLRVWCGKCYQAGRFDRFHINQQFDEDGNEVYDCPSDKGRYKEGVDGAHLMCTFQCDVCMFRCLFKRDPRNTVGDYEHMTVIRRMNLDAIWAREPTTIRANMRSLKKLVETWDRLGLQPNIPTLGPLPREDCYGYAVAFSMLMQSLNPGRYSADYTQFATIHKQRSAFSNLYYASSELHGASIMLNSGIMSNGVLAKCGTNSIWFERWSLGCETRMGYVLKQNKAITIDVLVGVVNEFVKDIVKCGEDYEAAWMKICGLAYAVITFHASLRGNEGLKVHFPTLEKYWEKGNVEPTSQRRDQPPPHVIVPIYGRFKGKQGKRCHLLLLANITKSGINIRGSINIIRQARFKLGINSVWLFCDKQGNKMSIDDMNDIILDMIEQIKEKDKDNELDLKEYNVREEFSINRSFRRGSSTRAQVLEISTDIIELVNRWKKVERAKGRQAKLSMIETYADIEILIPKVVKYSAML